MMPNFTIVSLNKVLKSFLTFIVVSILSINTFAQVTVTETFEDEGPTVPTTGNSQVKAFGQSGINFTASGRLRVQGNASTPFGANNSFYFLDSGDGPNMPTVTGNIGSFSINNAATSFRINSFAAYTASDPLGNNRVSGNITFIGTKVDGTTANAVVTITPTNTGTFVQNGLTFAGTALNGIYLTSLAISLPIGIQYIELDDINFTTQAVVANQFSINDISMIEGNSGPSNMTFTISRTSNTAASSVQVQSSNGTAIAGSDYVAFPLTTVNFTAGGALTQTVNVTVNGDVTPEANENLTMTLSNASAGSVLLDATGIGTILDDDAVTETFETEIGNTTTFSETGVSFLATGKFRVANYPNLGAGGSNFVLATPAPFSTGNQGSIKVSTAGKSFSMLSVDLWSASASGNTYNVVNSTVTFTGSRADGTGTVTHSAAITPTGTNGHFTVNFAGSPLAGIPLIEIAFSTSSTANFLQIDNFTFAPQTISNTQLSINDISILEGTGNGTTAAIFTITRTNNSTAFSVDIASSNGSATAGSDYTAIPTTTLNFMNGGSLSQTVTVLVNKDATVEPRETFNLTLSNATNGTLYLKQIGIGTILNDDGTISETFEDELNEAVAFSESAGSFSATGGYKVRNASTFGSGSSAFYLTSPNNVVGSMGTISITTPNTAFKIVSLDAWVGTSTSAFSSGPVTFTGTLLGGGTVSTTKTITATTNTGAGWQQNITFTGTPLHNVNLTSLQITSGGSLKVVDIDNFNYTVVSTLPVIEITDASNVVISNGGPASLSNNTDFGITCVAGGSVSKTFTIKNTGFTNLVLPNPPNLTLGGANANQFSIFSYPGTPITPGGSSTFTIIFDPTSGGVKNATLTITSNDADNNPFVLNIRGEGIADPVYTTTTNNALSFDGVNDFVIAESCTPTPFINGGSAITVEYWFKGSNIQSAVRTQDPSNNYVVAGWSFPPKHILSNDGGTSGGVAVGAAATDGNWHHVAFTWQQGATNGFKSYLDGQLIQQRNALNVPLPAINAPLFLGSFQGSSEFMNGTIDEVRVWALARTQAQIQAGMTAFCSQFTLPQGGLLAYYKFDVGIANGSNSSLIIPNLATNNFFGLPRNFAGTGITSNFVTGTFQEVEWLGTIDGNWTNPANWGCNQLPNLNSTVVIGAGRPNYPTQNVTGSIYKLKVNTGGTITVPNNQGLTIRGQ